MADSDKTLKIVIEATDAASPAIQKVAAETEALTNTGKGLAGSVPDLTAATDKFTVSTEVEYRALVKAHEALSNRITVMQASGKSVVDELAVRAKLDEALSSENALRIAGNIETRAAAAASELEAAAVKEEAAGHVMNATAMRESAVIMREIMQGRTTRLAGSLSILAQSLGVAGNAVMAFSIIGFGAFEAYRLLQEKLDAVNKEADALDQKNLEAHLQAIGNVRDAWLHARESVISYQMEIADAGQSKDPLDDQLKRIQEVTAAKTEAHFKRMEQLNAERIAFMKAHPDRFSDAQIAAVEETQSRQETAARDAAANRSIDQIQADIDQRKKNQPFFDRDQYDAAGAAALAQSRLDQATKEQKAAYDAANQTKMDKAITDAKSNLDEASAEPDMIVLPDSYVAQKNIAKAGDVASAQAALKAAQADLDRNNSARAAADKAVQQATDAKTIADKAKSDAETAGKDNASKITSETTEVGTKRAVELAKEHQQQIDAILNTVTTFHGLTLGKIAEATGKTNQQIEAIANEIVGGHLNLQTVLNMLMQQLANSRTQQGGQG